MLSSKKILLNDYSSINVKCQSEDFEDLNMEMDEIDINLILNQLK
jgi:hypothetical protein